MSSGLNWGRVESLRRADPYLAWADRTNYASYRLPFVPDKKGWWLVLIELAPGNKQCSPMARLLNASDPQWLQVPDVYLDKRVSEGGFRYCTARVGQRFFREVLSGSLKKVVSRYRLCSPVEYPVAPLFRSSTLSRRIAPAPKQNLAGANGKKVIALIDGGLAFANAEFLTDAKKTRLAYYWRQDDFQGSRYLRDRPKTSSKASRVAPWKKTRGLGYGAELDRAGINQTLESHTKPQGGRIDESGVYDQLGLWDLDRLVHHGSHVASLAVGRRRLPREPGTQEPPPFIEGDQGHDPHGGACDVLAVQLAWATVLDTSCRSCDAYILDALMYAWSRTHPKAHLVVNLSWGGNAGPHDGSSILERAMLDWCDLRERELTQVVVPAGNHYQSQMHANDVVKGKHPLHLTWRIPPDCHTPNFLELWFDKSTEDLLIELTPPDAVGQTVRVKAKSPSARTLKHFDQVVATLVFVKHSYLGRGPMALIAIEPTAGSGSLAWSGQWKISVSSTQEVLVDAFVERNDVAIGLFTGAKQSYLEDRGYNTGGARDQSLLRLMGPDNVSSVRRRGSLNHLSTGSDGRRVLSVGGIPCLQTKKRTTTFAPYSPPWDSAKQTRSRRKGTKEEPEFVAISEYSSSARGVRAAATRSGAVVRLVGTSSAVPQVARLLINEDCPFPKPLPPPGIWE